ncbi:Zinc finger, SWIM-type [Penicillium expansum]|uniref:Zinc finger, SWIM-type n=1 Tax=Penicillium expansum TaxID=27334 RepID=A0A0A2L9T1_PENEN|nr:Zinc finger, SWIM-type [Penicillium expansum]KGO56654.1 Zinc finger, SWIM-type [Penicillium expansum]KGO73375.1 Zinc finger, SWIM-type [Penicillium expansum]
MPDTVLPARAARAGRSDTSNDDSDPGDDRSSEESSSDEEEEDEDEDEESSDEEQSESNSSSVLATSGITYDLSQLDSESEARAVVGLTGHFDVVNCRSTPAGYDFQLSDRPQVHIGADSSTCTCAAFQDQPDGACQHIFWLVDQLHGCFLPAPRSTEVTLTPDGRPERLPRIEDLLKGNLMSVATQLKWQCLREEEDGMTRTEKVRDIFSAFSNRTLPEDTRRDLTETTEQARTAEQCVVQGDFEATMFRLAVHDDGVFNSLCKAMPAGACAAIYFDKVQEQSRRLLNDFDRYCATGELPANPVSPDLGVEINDVVTQLQRSVSRIEVNIAARAPHGSEGAAEALVSLLESVVARNNDPLEGNPLGRQSFHGEDEDQRNLYHLLIGSVETDSETDARHFVLHALDALPPVDLHQCANRLRDILRKIEVNRAPKPYLLHLGSLIRTAESAAAAAMGSGQKRPAAGNGNSGGYSKRTR